ncbi:hypothetical protein DNY80_24400 [Salmonella enterica subsp. enterica serovar Kentucky]|nr:hypothetical protein [Salmonella enterica subsp. enterica serovar Kentucky]
MKDMFAQGGSGSVGIKTNKQAIARHFGIKPNEVVYFSTGTDLSGYKVIYDKERQRAYALPVNLPVGTTAINLTVAAVLTHSGGTVDLGDLAATLGEYVTLSGSFDTGFTINTHNELVTFTDGSYRWAGVLPKEVAPGSNPNNSGGISDTAWVAVGSVNLKNLIKSTVGASNVGTASGKSVQQELDTLSFGSTVNVSEYANLKDAIAALPVFGGRVLIPNGNFFVGDWDAADNYMNKPNVVLVGSKLPRLNSTASALIDGSVLEGRFNVCAHGFAVSNVGFDCGKDVVTKYWPTLNPAVDFLRGGTWDAFAFGQPSQVTPVTNRYGFSAINIIGLCYSSEAIGHAVLIENVGDGYVDNVVGIYGTHGVVIKSQNIRGGSIAGYMAKVDNVIFKSDTYAGGGNIQLSCVTAKRNYPGVTPHTPAAKAEMGIYFNPETEHFTGPIHIGSAIISGATYGILNSNADSGKIGGDIHFGVVDVDTDIDYALFSSNFGEFPRFTIDTFNIKNVLNGIYLNWTTAGSSGTPQTTIGTLNILYCTDKAIIMSGYARAHINKVNVFGAATAYFSGENARLTVGCEQINATAKWDSGPILGPGWGAMGTGNSEFDVFYSGGQVHMKGLITGGTSGLIATLPPHLRPTESKRYLAYRSGSPNTCLIGVSAAGLVTINDGTAIPSGEFISLDGICWKNS